MKTFISGIVGAVVAGLLLFFAQNWWSEGQTSAKQRISFDKQSDISLTKAELNQLAGKANDYLTPSVQVFEVSNVGTDDISDRSFSAATSDVMGYAAMTSPNGNPKNATFSYDGKVLTVRYRLLPAGAKHTFWVASSAPSIFPDFANDSSGVHVVTSTEKMSAADTPFPWGWVGAIAISFIMLLIGVALGETEASNQLKKRGFDYKEIIKRRTADPPAEA